MTRPITSRSIVVALAVSGATFASRAVVAAPPPRADAGTAADDTRAAELKRRGDDLLDAKHFTEALEAYDASYALSPSPALLYNRGRALQFLGRYPDALAAIERFDAEAPAALRARVPGLQDLLAELRGRVGTLVVRCGVAGARVLVDQKQVGVTPLAPSLRVSAGHLSIDLFAEGYFPLHREVELPGNGTITVELLPVSRDTSGLLTVRSRIDATRVTIDGRALGVAPVEAGLTAGSHAVVATRDGYDDATTQVVLRAGDKRELSIDPIARPPLYARWWFWTAVGVVVAGGVVTYVALTTERRAAPGDYSPGIVHF